MPDINFTSPVRIINTSVLSSYFNIEDDAAETGPYAALTLSYTITESDENIPMPNCKRILDVTCTWFSDPEGTKKCCEANCKMGIVVGYEQSIGFHLHPSEIEEFLNEKAVDIAYSKIRSYIEAMTAESVLGKLTIPVIDASEYVKSVAEQS